MVTIKVLTANLWLLPPPTSLDNTKRLDGLIDLVIELDPDVVNLQEVWLKQYVNRIKTRLKNYHLVTPKSIFYNKSGLVTLLKQRPLKSQFHQFGITKEFNTIERFAGKGFLKTQFAFKGNLFTVINTHIYQSEDEKRLELKLNQIKEVVKKARKHNPTIIAGDLNTPPRSYGLLLSKLITEPKIPVTYSESNKYAHKAVNMLLNKEGVYNTHPDRIITNIKSKQAKVKVVALTNVEISDHYPLLAEVTLPRGKYIKTSLSRGKRILGVPKKIVKKILPI